MFFNTCKMSRIVFQNERKKAIPSIFRSVSLPWIFFLILNLVFFVFQGVHLEDSHIPKPWGSGDALDIPVEGYRNSPSPDLHRAGGRHNRKSHSDCHPKASLAVTKQYEGSHSLGIPQTKPKHKTGFNFFSHLPSRRHSSSDKEQNQQNFETHCEIITEQFQDKCSTGSSGNSRDGKHAYDSAIELEMDSGKVYTSQEHLNVPLPSPTSDFQEASTETSEKNSQKENDSKASRKNRFKRMMRPISRSHSAGCGKDVPAHALFLASRRNSQPSEVRNISCLGNSCHGYIIIKSLKLSVNAYFLN